MKKSTKSLAFGVLLLTLSAPCWADKNMSTSAFFDAATCNPPYSTAYAMDIYNLAEKMGKANMSSMSAVYHLPSPIKRDGFVAQDVFFSGSTVGVLVEGNVVDKLAKQYNLTPEKLNIINMTGFSRQLPDAQQGLKELGLISLVALTSSAFKDKTLLACQFVSNEDRKNMQFLNRK